MRILAKPVMSALLCGLSLCVWAQERSSDRTASALRPEASGNHGRKAERTIIADDGLSVIAAALDPKVRRYAGRDCSHLVHAVYDRAGFPYAYASSDDLYAGVESFQRVAQPQTGDLIVWHGHVGIVVRPSRHVFFSFMSKGPGIDDYESPYWRSRGRPRFYRYLQNADCTGCTSVSASLRKNRDDN